MKLRDVITGLSIAVLGFVGGVAAAVYGIFKVAGKTDVLSDVTIPGIKRTITDTVSAFVERAVFGKDRIPKRVNYSKYNTKYSSARPHVANFDDAGIDIRYNSRTLADNTFTWILKQIETYGSVSCKELMNHIGYTAYDETQYKWDHGWTEKDSNDITITSHRYLPDSWIIELPAPHRI